eukprot:3308944-Pleurochrysis_carterae.AAC.10
MSSREGPRWLHRWNRHRRMGEKGGPGRSEDLPMRSTPDAPSFCPPRFMTAAEGSTEEALGTL